MSQPPASPAEFTDAELWTLSGTLQERYGKAPVPRLGEAEMRLWRRDHQVTARAIVPGQRDDCTLRVARAGDRRCELFYRAHRHHATVIDRFDNLAECVVTRLQVRADHAHDLQQQTEEALPR